MYSIEKILRIVVYNLPKNPQSLGIVLFTILLALNANYS